MQCVQGVLALIRLPHVSDTGYAVQPPRINMNERPLIVMQLKMLLQPDPSGRALS